MRLRLGGTVIQLTHYQRPILVAFIVLCVFILMLGGGHRGDDDTETAARGQRSSEHRARGKDSINELRFEKGKGYDKRRRGVVSRDEVVADSDYDAAVRGVITDWGSQRDSLRPVQREILAAPRPADSIYNFNVTASERASLDRIIEDTRPKACSFKEYDVDSLPDASVVIPFYNEALPMLLRTIHSILNRSPESLLREIILVDDKSSRENLAEPLNRYVNLLPKVTLLRNLKREGLIRSRLRGSNLAKGEVVIFLDAHTEANIGWLEPLLDEIKRNPNTVAQPFIDAIDDKTINYSQPPTIYQGSFSWDLRYIWLRIPDHEQDQIFADGHSFWTSTLVGCAIAVDKNYFNKIGTFDEDLEVWGGENIELAWRAWMCGGRVLTVTCSRVGHMFKEFPYRFGSGDKDKIVEKNLMRVAETWMGSYKKYFYASTRIYEFKRVKFAHKDLKSLQKRIQIKRQLKCKNFDWFMSNILPQMEIPPMNAVYYGEIMNVRSDLCFEVAEDGMIISTFHCFKHKIILRNIFRLTRDGLLQWRDRCVRMAYPRPHLQVDACPEKNRISEFGKWNIINKGHVWGLLSTTILSRSNNKHTFCVTQTTSKLPHHYKEQMPHAVSCDRNERFQHWSFTYKFDYTV